MNSKNLKTLSALNTSEKLGPSYSSVSGNNTLSIDGTVADFGLGDIYLIGSLYSDKKDNMKNIDYLPKSLRIKNIAYCDNPGKEKVILVFEDDSKVIKEMRKGDTFDLKIGVALAFMEKLYESKTQYHKTIQKKLQQKK